jgi:hypothetical protein
LEGYVCNACQELAIDRYLVVRQPLVPLGRLIAPLYAFFPLRLAMREQSRCSTSQIVPLRVESIWEGVKPHIFGLWFSGIDWH